LPDRPVWPARTRACLIENKTGSRERTSREPDQAQSRTQRRASDVKTLGEEATTSVGLWMVIQLARTGCSATQCLQPQWYRPRRTGHVRNLSSDVVACEM